MANLNEKWKIQMKNWKIQVGIKKFKINIYQFFFFKFNKI